MKMQTKVKLENGPEKSTHQALYKLLRLQGLAEADQNPKLFQNLHYNPVRGILLRLRM